MNRLTLLILECTHGLKTVANRRKVFEEGSFNQSCTTNIGQNISQDIILELRHFHTCRDHVNAPGVKELKVLMA